MIKMNEEFKTFEELKEELGDKFEEYMYGSNINLLNNWNELKKWLEEEIKEYQKDKYPSDYGLVLGFIQVTQQKMQELEQGKDE